MADKLLRFVDRIAAFKDGRNPPPITVSLDITYGCGHRCPDCTGDPGWKLSALEELTDPEFRGIFGQLHDSGVLSITFVGAGDTMVRPGSEKLITYAHSLGLDVGLLSNGQIMSASQALELIQALKFVRISLDASDPEMFKETHGMEKPSEFYRVLGTLELLVKTRRELASECKIGVSYLTRQSTLRGMAEATRMANRLGADYIYFKPFRGDLTLIDEKLVECKIFETPDFKVLSSGPKYDSARQQEKRAYDTCYAQQFLTQIDPNGDVTICCDHKGDPDMVLGNLREETFREIWESDNRKRIVSNLDVSKCIPYCRGDPMNMMLYQVMKKQEHESFL